MIKQLCVIALSLTCLNTAFAVEKGTCKATSFSNGRYDLDESKHQCNQEKGYFPLLDTTAGKCSCEKGFEFEIKAQRDLKKNSTLSLGFYN